MILHGHQTEKNILFISVRDGHSNVYQIASDGTDFKQMYADPEFNNNGPLFSPNGKSIIFASANEDGGVLKLLAEDQSIYDLLYEQKDIPVYYLWSPDGQYLAINVTPPNEKAHLSLIDTKIYGVHELTEGGINSIPLFSWSPDSKQIVFQSNQSGSHEIYLLDVNSAVTTQITHNDKDDLFPSWSPPSCR